MELWRLAKRPAPTAPPANSLCTTLPTIKKIRAVLAKNPSIRRRKPSKQRLEVHAGDMVNHLRRAAGELIGNDEDEEMKIAAYLEGVEARKEEERRKKQSR